MDAEFTSYQCTCDDLETPPPLIYRRNTFTCVIRNYLVYLKVRHLTNYVDTRKLERVLAFTDDNGAFNISWSRNMDDVCVERAGNITLCLSSPVCHTTIAKHLDAQCCLEFIGFVQKHVQVDIMPDDVKASNDFLKFVAPKKF